jgi:hypothetical protein
LVNTVGAEEADKIVKGQRKVITTCGSGMTAGILWLGLKLLGAEHVGLYDEVSLIKDAIVDADKVPYSRGRDMRAEAQARLRKRSRSAAWV